VSNPVADLRIRGDEVQVVVTSGGELEMTLTAIRSFEITDNFTLISQGYLGEKSERKDFIFTGSSFNFEAHLSKREWFQFKQALRAKAQRQTPTVIFSISGIFTFPDGSQIAETLPNCSFGDVPQTVGSRNDYVTVRLSGAVGASTVTDL
jgi:hypothetical protein